VHSMAFSKYLFSNSCMTFDYGCYFLVTMFAIRDGALRKLRLVPDGVSAFPY